MSHYYTNELAPGVLCNKLSAEDRRRFCLRTCCDILEGNQFLENGRVNLCPKNVCFYCDFRGLTKMHEINRYRAFSIKDTLPSTATGTQYMDMVRKFMFQREVKDTIEYLELNLKFATLEDVFAAHYYWLFPRLRALNYNTSMYVTRPRSFFGHLDVPMLTRLQLNDPNVTIRPFLARYSEQIRELTVKFIDKDILYETLCVQNFTNLHSLTLCVEPDDYFHKVFCKIDFDRRYMEIFARLKYLEIMDRRDMFYCLYETIFKTAENLEILSVDGRHMSEDAFIAIGGLKQLKELTLFVDVLGNGDVGRLFLPRLVKLTTYKMTSASLPGMGYRLREYGEQTEECRALEALRSLKIDAAIVDNVHPGMVNLNPSDFEQMDVLGMGGFGKVYQVRKKIGADAGCYYAMKVVEKSRARHEKDRAHAITERNILATVKHPFIVKLAYTLQTAKKLYFIMEYLSGGDLHTKLSSERFFSSDTTRFYLCEIILALEYLHGLNIVYRDLKLENIMLDAQGHIKLTDFGLSKENIQKRYATNTFCGTIRYMAPEVLIGVWYGKAVDWWALGVLMYFMLTGMPPFTADSRVEIMAAIMKGKIDMPDYLEPDSGDLILRLVERHVEKRLGSGPTDGQEVRAHAYFKNVNWYNVLAKRLEPPFKPTLQSEDDAPHTNQRPVDFSDDPGSGDKDFPEFTYTAPMMLEEIAMATTAHCSRQMPC